MGTSGLLVSVIVLGACGGVTADQPLTIGLGLPRAQTDAALAHHKYCHSVDGPRPDVETYPRCKRTGADLGDSWVVATYQRDRLVELRRYERFSEDAHATERWNQLVADREKVTPSSPEAAQALRSRALEPGTRTVKAFRVDAHTVVGVYLLTPRPPDNASVLEAVFELPVK